MRVRKENILQDIALKNLISIESNSFYLQKFNVNALKWPDSKKIVLSWRIEHL